MLIINLLGKSGAGKSTVEKCLENVGFERVVSYTTRKIRDGEVNHREYHFVSEATFKRLIDKGIIIEWAMYRGNYYGAPRPIGCSKAVIVTEPDGMRSLKDIYENQVFSVYIDTSDEEIKNRLSKRNNTTDVEQRQQEDKIKFKGIKEEVDLVVDGNKSVTSIVVDIMAELVARKLV